MARSCSRIEGVQQRDRFVVDLLRERGIPWVMVLSGGYSDESHRLIAATGIYLLGGPS
jgi:acetoin utilization deacetylase AcuC-like enzyme